ncbi:MAG: Rieske (2Fe-2S) protein [Ardenticatenaceae bacterium]|nr:Rieske (2Fe-2S) protein [Ardenticatenaceae bacterium]
MEAIRKQNLTTSSAQDCGCTERSLTREISRRDFIKLGLGALSAIAALEIGAASWLFLQARGQEERVGGKMVAGSVEDFPPGSVTEFKKSAFFLIRDAAGGFLAVYRRCPHLGCTVNWQPGGNGFHCPCHSADFDFYGDCQGPPVPRPLDTFAISIDEDRVMVDMSQPQQREQFNPTQLIYA